MPTCTRVGVLPVLACRLAQRAFGLIPQRALGLIPQRAWQRAWRPKYSDVSAFLLFLHRPGGLAGRSRACFSQRAFSVLPQRARQRAWQRAWQRAGQGPWAVERLAPQL